MQTSAAPPARRPLSRELILTTSLDLIEREGLREFSARKLGRALGCEAMSVYHHFPSKAHILDALVDRLVDEIPMPADSLPPLERLRAIMRGYRTIAVRYPHFSQFFIVHRMESAPALAKLDAAVKACRDLGLDTEAAARLFRVLSYYLMGAILDETQGYAKGPGSLDPVPEDEWDARFPHIAAAGEYFTPEHFETTFELGLDLLLGAVPRLKKRSRPAPEGEAGRQGRLW